MGVWRLQQVMGDFHPLAAWSARRHTPGLSYLAGDWPEMEMWRTTARAKTHELLAYEPPSCRFDPVIERRYEREGLLVELVTYGQPFGPRTEGLYLRPTDKCTGLPGVLALHDHGAFKYFGKEKLVDLDDEPEILMELKGEFYEGRSWATELAKRGFAVFVPDLFLWGSRKMDPDSLPPDLRAPILREKPGSREYIKAYNDFAREHESTIAKTLFLAGTTWPGIMAYEDRRALDYLLTRPEVDPARIGCGGLSGGGLRTIFLAGLDERVKCAVCSGFMSVNEEVLANKTLYHTWMLYVPYLSRYLDMPDIISLHGPAPLMLQCNNEDGLWTLAGQRQADAKLKAIYGKMDAPDHYQGRFYPGPHKFDRRMQEDAFAWFERWLGVGEDTRQDA